MASTPSAAPVATDPARLTLFQHLVMVGIKKPGMLAERAKVPHSAVSSLLQPGAYPKARERVAKALGISVSRLLVLIRNELDRMIEEQAALERARK